MRYFLRKIVYCLLYIVYRLTRPFLHKPEVAVLMYHSVSDNGWFFSVSLEEFERQIRYLFKKKHPVRLEDIADFVANKKSLPSRAVAITFDDGYRDFKENALPILRKYGIPAILFVCTGEINAENLGSDLPLLTAGEISELSQDPLVTIGSHGLTHGKLTRFSPEMAENEIDQSRVLLEKMTGKPINFFAYPKGSFNSLIMDYTEKAGYRAAFSAIQRLVDRNCGFYGIPRVQIDRSTSFLEFKAKLTRAVNWYEKIWKILN